MKWWICLLTCISLGRLRDLIVGELDCRSKGLKFRPEVSIWCFLGQTLYFPPGLGYRLRPDLFPGNYTLYVQFLSASYPNLTYIFVVQWGILIVFLNTLHFSCREVRLNPSAVQVIFNIYIYCSKNNFPKFFLLVIHLSSNLREKLFF